MDHFLSQSLRNRSKSACFYYSPISQNQNVCLRIQIIWAFHFNLNPLLLSLHCIFTTIFIITIYDVVESCIIRYLIVEWTFLDIGFEKVHICWSCHLRTLTSNIFEATRTKYSYIWWGTWLFSIERYHCFFARIWIC